MSKCVCALVLSRAGVFFSCVCVWRTLFWRVPWPCRRCRGLPPTKTLHPVLTRIGWLDGGGGTVCPTSRRGVTWIDSRPWRAMLFAHGSKPVAGMFHLQLGQKNPHAVMRLGTCPWGSPGCLWCRLIGSAPFSVCMYACMLRYTCVHRVFLAPVLVWAWWVRYLG